jgi:trans-aconitate 2-methyltransferase
MPWDPERYEQFKKERSAPFDDLLRLVRVRDGLRAVDLGCGTGELTRRLADALPESEVLGMDSSAEMLERAGKVERPGLRFEMGDIQAFAGSWDVIFSNAALQWVNDHRSLIPRLFSLLQPGGQLVVQVPSNFDHPTHRLIDELAAQEPFRSGLGGWGLDWSRSRPVLSIEQYAELLYAQGATKIVVFEMVYPHVLPDAGALADWMSGTALVPYMERLADGLRDAFIERYRTRLREIVPQEPVFYGFRRTLFAGTKPA